MLYRYTELEENGENVFDLDRVESFGAGEGGLPYHIIERTLENILAGVFRISVHKRLSKV